MKSNQTIPALAWAAAALFCAIGSTTAWAAGTAGAFNGGTIGTAICAALAAHTWLNQGQANQENNEENENEFRTEI